MFDIVEIELENFKAYRGTHKYRFPTAPGLYCLRGRNDDSPRLGANGAGKSSFLDAIFWCLYGRTPRGLKAADIVNWQEKSARVALAIYTPTERGQLVRTQNPNSLTLGGRTVDQTEVNEMLRLGPEAFLYSVMMAQFGQCFFDLSAAQKLTLFSEIMGLDYWLEKSEVAATKAKRLEQDLNKLERRLADAGGKLTVTAADFEVLKGKQATFATDQRAKLKNLRKDIKGLLSNLEAQKLRHRQSLTAKDAAAIRLDILDRSCGHGACKACGQTIRDEAYDKDRKSLLVNHRDHEDDCRRTDRELAKIEQSLQVAKRELVTAEAAVSPYFDMLKTKAGQVAQLETDIVEYRLEIERLQAMLQGVSFWVGGFKRVRLFVVEEALSALEIEVNNNLTSLGLTEWQIKFDVERENKSGGITKGFAVFVHPPGSEVPVKFESYSGGETQRLRMAGDLGLANLIMERAGLENKVEFFDEPSNHLSQEGLIDLAETLNQRAQLLDRKVWIIDHRTIDYGGFTDTLWAIKTDAGTALVQSAVGTV